MSKTTIAYVKLVRDEHGTIIYSEDADHLLRDAVALRAQAYRDGYKAGKDAEREACLQIADECAEADVHASVTANCIRARK